MRNIRKFDLDFVLSNFQKRNIKLYIPVSSHQAKYNYQDHNNNNQYHQDYEKILA